MSETPEDRWTPRLLIVLLVVQLVFLAGLYLRLERIERRLADLQRAGAPAATADGGNFVEVPGFDAGDGPSRGPAEAAVTLVEFSDFLCGACRQAQPVLAELAEELGDDLRVIYRHFPLRPGGDHFAAAVAAECAHRQGAFWPFHDRLFAQAGEIPAQDLPGHAAALGLDAEEFASCTGSEETAEKVRADRQAGLKWGVQGTPTFFINGYRVAGMPGSAAMRRYIERARPAGGPPESPAQPG